MQFENQMFLPFVISIDLPEISSSNSVSYRGQPVGMYSSDLAKLLQVERKQKIPLFYFKNYNIIMKI